MDRVRRDPRTRVRRPGPLSVSDDARRPGRIRAGRRVGVGRISGEVLMVDTSLVNGDQHISARVLPEMIQLTAAESQRIPSPGTQRALKAETGQSWDRLVGPDADSADRIQTMIWIQLRRTIPDLHWDECAD